MPYQAPHHPATHRTLLLTPNVCLRQIHWHPTPTTPTLIHTISLDGHYRTWSESPTVPPNTGRRFLSSRPGSHGKPLYELRSPPRSPYMSFSLTHNPSTRSTHLALLDRGGALRVYENDTPETPTSWSLLDEFQACDRPPRGGAEVSLKVRFDPNLEPSWAAQRAGVPSDSLGLVVAGMRRVTMWRTKQVRHEVTLGAGTAKEFYIAADLMGHGGLVRDVAWGRGSWRGWDVVATACADGLVRVYEIRAPEVEGPGSVSFSQNQGYGHESPRNGAATPRGSHSQQLSAAQQAQLTDGSSASGGGRTASVAASASEPGAGGGATLSSITGDPPIRYSSVSTTASAPSSSSQAPTPTQASTGPTAQQPKAPAAGTAAAAAATEKGIISASLLHSTPALTQAQAQAQAQAQLPRGKSKEGEVRCGVRLVAELDPSGGGTEGQRGSGTSEGDKKGGAGAGQGGAVWRVQFDDDGVTLGSTGDDGRLVLWRRQGNGEWGRASEMRLERGRGRGDV